MGVLEILALVFLFLGFVMIIPFSISEFHCLHSYKVVEKKEEDFQKTFGVPGVIFLISLFLALAGIALLISSCAVGSYLNDSSSVWMLSLIIGMLAGLVIGVIYWMKVRKPFFIKYFPKEFSGYEKETKKTPGTTRASYIQWIFIGSFVLSGLGIGAFLGILLAYMI